MNAVEFYWRYLYQPEKGMFSIAPKDLGNGKVRDDEDEN